MCCRLSCAGILCHAARGPGPRGLPRGASLWIVSSQTITVGLKPVASHVRVNRGEWWGCGGVGVWGGGRPAQMAKNAQERSSSSACLGQKEIHKLPPPVSPFPPLSLPLGGDALPADRGRVRGRIGLRDGFDIISILFSDHSRPSRRRGSHPRIGPAFEAPSPPPPPRARARKSLRPASPKPYTRSLELPT